IATTLPGTPILSRLKSMVRYSRLAPPPTWRIVSLPLLFRPPLRLTGLVSRFSGSVFVMSANEPTDPNRRPGDVGLYGLMGILLVSVFGIRWSVFGGRYSVLGGRSELHLSEYRK